MTLDTAYPAGVTLTSTQTLTNKRITPRVGTVASSATPTINTDNVDIFEVTALAVAITSMTTNLSGTPTEGQELIINITGTAARAITWGASFEDSAITLPTTTVTTAMLSVFLRWNSATSKWRCMGATVAGGVTYPLIGSLGAVGAPTYSFTGGVDGMWSSAANTLDFSAGSVRGLQLNTVASGVNYFSLTPAAASGTLSLAAAGSDSDIAVDYTSKGTDSHNFRNTNNADYIASYRCRIQAKNDGATNAPLILSSQGQTAEMSFRNNGLNNVLFYLNGVASAANYLSATNAATGDAPTLNAEGSDTNIDVKVVPKGSGVLQFGVATAAIAVASTHKIAIKAADGTTYYILATT